ncbi:hypothetical protein ABPG72_015354 [Tetrahymena utriculariae]
MEVEEQQTFTQQEFSLFLNQIKQQDPFLINVNSKEFKMLLKFLEICCHDTNNKRLCTYHWSISQELKKENSGYEKCKYLTRQQYATLENHKQNNEFTTKEKILKLAKQNGKCIIENSKIIAINAIKNGLCKSEEQDNTQKSSTIKAQVHQNTQLVEEKGDNEILSESSKQSKYQQNNDTALNPTTTKMRQCLKMLEIKLNKTIEKQDKMLNSLNSIKDRLLKLENLSNNVIISTLFKKEQEKQQNKELKLEQQKSVKKESKKNLKNMIPIENNDQIEYNVHDDSQEVVQVTRKLKNTIIKTNQNKTAQKKNQSQKDFSSQQDSEDTNGESSQEGLSQLIKNFSQSMTKDSQNEKKKASKKSKTLQFQERDSDYEDCNSNDSIFDKYKAEIDQLFNDI